MHNLASNNSIVMVLSEVKLTCTGFCNFFATLAKDTSQSLLETISLLKKCCCHKRHCGGVGCAAVWQGSSLVWN